MNKKILLAALFTISASMQGAATTAADIILAAGNNSIRETIPTVENIPNSLLVLIRTGLVACPNPNCSKKKDKEPKTVKDPRYVYHGGSSYGASCDVCGDKRDIKYFAD